MFNLTKLTVTVLDILFCIYVKNSKLILKLSIKQALTILVLFALDISSEWGHLFRNKGKRDNFEWLIIMQMSSLSLFFSLSLSLSLSLKNNHKAEIGFFFSSFFVYFHFTLFMTYRDTKTNPLPPPLWCYVIYEWPLT